MKKKLLTLLPLLAVPMIALTGCDNRPQIGILQPEEHGALDASRKGFQQAIKDEGVTGYKFAYSNARGKSANLNSLAKNLVDSSVLTLGIATPAAVALKGAAENAGSTKPILFTAVTDPVKAKLVASADNPSGYICGTTDANPVEEQIALVKEFNPEASKVGIMYTQTEINSKVQADQAKAAIEAAGMTADIKTCTDTSNIKTTAEALVSDSCNAIYIPTDNNIAANMNAVKEAAASKGVLVICGEENMLSSGGHVTLSIDYYNLGYSTGKMAAAILKGEKAPTDFKVEPVPASNCSYAYSPTNLASANITMPEAVKNAHNWKEVA